MNIMITGEEYNEYEAQKEKIKELEARNDFLKEQYDQLNDAQKNKIKALEEQVDHWKMQFESTYENYQQALSKNVALIKERDRFKIRNAFLEKEHAEISELNLKQGEAIIAGRGLIAKQDKMIETLQAKVAHYDNKDIRFKELNSENYRLRMSNNDLKENNKALKKENDKLEAEKEELKDIIAKNTARHNEMLFEKDKLINRLHDYESQIAELAEKATNPDYVKFLEMAKKFQESNVGILTELEETTQPERNVIIIENQYNEYRCDFPFCNNNDI